MDCVIAALVRYVNLSKEEQQGAVWIVQAREKALRSVSIDNDQITT